MLVINHLLKHLKLNFEFSNPYRQKKKVISGIYLFQTLFSHLFFRYISLSFLGPDTGSLPKPSTSGASVYSNSAQPSGGAAVGPAAPAPCCPSSPLSPSPFSAFALATRHTTSTGSKAKSLKGSCKGWQTTYCWWQPEIPRDPNHLGWC